MPTPTKTRRWTRRFAILLIPFAAVAAAMLVTLKSEPGRAGLARLVSAVATRQAGMKISISGIGPGLPGDLHVEAITLRDGDGDWLTIRNAHMAWSPGALLRGRMLARVVEAEAITVMRLPQPAAEAEPPSPEEPFALPQLPAYLDRVTVERLRVGECMIAPALAGVEATLSIEGSFSPGGGSDNSQLALTIERLGGPTARLDLAVDLADFPQAMPASFVVDDATLVADIAGRPELRDMHIELKGAGPATQWQGTLTARSAGADLASTEIALRLGPSTGLSLSGEAWLTHPVVPQSLRSLMGEHATFGVGLEYGARLAAEQVHIESGAWSATGSASYTPETRGVEFEATVDCREVGVLGEDAPSELAQSTARAHLRGRGDVEELTGDLALSIDAAQALAVDWTLGTQAAPRLKATCTLQPNVPGVPPSLAEVGTIAADLDVAYEAGSIRLHPSRVEMLDSTLGLEGSLDAESLTGTGHIELSAPDLARIGPMQAFGIRGGATIAAAADVKAEGASLTMDLSTENLALTDAGSIANSQVRLEATRPGRLAWPPSGLEVTLSGQLADVVAAGISEPKVALSGKALVRSLDEIEVAAFEVNDGNVAITAKGAVDPSVLAAEVDLTLDVQELAQAIALAQSGAKNLPAVSGNAGFRAHAAITGGAKHVAAGLTGSLRNIEGLPAAVPPGLLESIEITAEGAFTEGQLTLPALHVASAGMAVEANGAYRLDTREAGLELRASIPAIQALTEAMSLDTEGDAVLEAAFSGTPSDGTLTAKANGKRIEVAGHALTGWKVDAEARGALTEAIGTLAVDAGLEGVPLSGRAEFALKTDRLSTDSMEIALGANRIEGAAEYAFLQKKLQGRAEAALPQLGELGTALGVGMAGQASASAAFDVAEGHSKVSLEAQADGVSVSGLSINHAEAKGDIGGTPESPEGALEVQADGLRVASVSVERLDAQARGEDGVLALQVTGNGNLYDEAPFDVALDGTVGSGFRSFKAQRLDAHVAQCPVSISESLQVTRAANAWAVGPGIIHIGEGQLNIGGEVSAGTTDLSMDLSGFPLLLLELFGGPPMGGVAAATARIQGSLAAPSVEAGLHLTGVQFLQAEAENVPLLGVDVSSSLADGRLEMESKLALGDVAEVSASGKLPVHMGLAPWRFELPMTQPIEAKLDAKTSLKPLPSMAGMSEHVLDGELTAHAQVGGSLSSPEVNGTVSLENGAYENGDTGVMLRGLNMLLEAKGPELSLTEFRATDGAKGALEVSGGLMLVPGEGFPFDMQVALKKAELIRRDELKATVNGNLTASGSLNEALVEGRVEVAPATVTIPERLPPNVTELEVVEVNKPAAAQAEAPPKGAPLTERVKLDVACHLPGRVFVRAATLDSEWTGDLAIQGTLAKPKVSGQLEVLRGHLSFLSRRFVLAESTIALDGAYPPKPLISLGASTRAAGLDARLKLHGTAQSMTLELTSDPPYPEDEILSKLLFDRSLAQITPVEALQLAPFIKMASGSKGLEILSRQPSILGVDRLELKQGEEPDDLSVGAGRYLTEDVYVEVEQGLGEDSSKVKVGVEVTPQVTVESETGTDAKTGLGIFWKKDY